jgi:hypothetical protein
VDNGLSHNQAAQKHDIHQPTLSGWLRGVPSKSEVTHPAQLLSKSQGSGLATWILWKDALSYALSHNQVRATVAALLRQRGPGKGYQCALDSQVHETSSSYQHEDREMPGGLKIQFFNPKWLLISTSISRSASIARSSLRTQLISMRVVP